MSTIELPVEIPISFVSKSTSGTVKIPASIPFSFSSKTAIKLPITLPLRFEAIGQIKKYAIIEYNEFSNLDTYHGKKVLPVFEKAVGKVVQIPYLEKAWKFPGLILQEKILSQVHNEVVLSENVQSLILVNFELLSTNTLKITWYGNSVPSFTIMKKSAVDEQYVSYGKYNWADEYAIFDIESEDYNVYLQGSENSGTSAVYTIAGVNDTLVIPEVEVLLNEKIHELEIDYTSEYRINIEY